MALHEYIVKSPTLDQDGVLKNPGERIVYDDEKTTLTPKEFKEGLDKALHLGPVGKKGEGDAEPEGSAQTATPAVDYNLVNAAVEAQVLAILGKFGITPEQVAAATAGDGVVEEEAPQRTKAEDKGAEKGAFDPVAVIDGNADTATKRLAGLDAAQLDAVRKAEVAAGNRKGLLDAIDTAKAAL